MDHPFYLHALFVACASFAALTLAYFVYGRFLAARVFQLDPHKKTPAFTKEDGIDYVPTKVPILFGHHFASIAGLGPILGPALAVYWGWLPAVLWVVIGCIFMGAVHDLGALKLSLHFGGRSIGDVCRELINPRARLLFLLLVFFLMSLAMGAFINAITTLFIDFRPDAINPSVGLMVVAIGVGIAVYRYKVPLGPATVVALMAFAMLIVWGVNQPCPTYQLFLPEETRVALNSADQQLKEQGQAGWTSPYSSKNAAAMLKATNASPAEVAGLETAIKQAKNTCIALLLAYGFLASVLPVWLLLQPRDYINSFQLYFALTLLTLGIFWAGVTGTEFAVLHAPAIRPVTDVDADPMFPFLFVTIACGAISGFHSLVSSGTTVRQLEKETDALPVGYGAMLVEGALAVLVILACGAGLGAQGWTASGPYASWTGVQGLGAQLNVVVEGGANFLSQLGIPQEYGSGLLAVTIVAFALTTLDSATRLLRFNVEEICLSVNLKPLANRWFGSIVAVAGIATFGLIKEGQTLWVLFGAGNQLLAGLTLLAVSLFLFKLGRPMFYTAVPMALMLCVTISALCLSVGKFYAAPDKQLLLGTTLGILALTIWLIVEAILAFSQGRTGLPPDAGPESKPEHDAEEMAAHTHLG